MKKADYLLYLLIVISDPIRDDINSKQELNI